MRHTVNHAQVINETIDGEAIMINLASGNYYSLDRVGGDVWSLLEAGCDLDGIVAGLAGRYDAPEEQLRTAVSGLLEQLAAEALVVPTADPPTRTSAVLPGADGRVPFSPPRLEKFTDMQDLILLDPVHEVGTQGWPYAAAGGADAPDAGSPTTQRSGPTS